ncbi:MULTISPECIES: metalloregulator ArsR/SmtB family transcription factor [Lacrimispora]|uniref:ArsR/SmtB family transcription factor n=1 Tax=Lacrimispora TaxID=2719231 RepID=UPI000BE356BC|nr:metalloregulator ArsR/SmtB family transcription factor [Lacrimispora amygdalina]MDK2968066.1 ArsR family transcriptional regulator, lead/cadmium/zinc/bismuth-responsive transcriptional [Lacrimispora sp.]
MGDSVNKCDCQAVNKELAEKVKSEMEDDSCFSYLSAFFKLISDDTRIKIMYALSKSELCVNDLAVILNMTKSAISHQLRLLKASGQVKSRKEGKFVYYSLDDEHVFEIMENALIHVKHKK